MRKRKQQLQSIYTDKMKSDMDKWPDDLFYSMPEALERARAYLAKTHEQFVLTMEKYKQ